MRIEATHAGYTAAAAAYRRNRVNRILSAEDHDGLSFHLPHEGHAMMTGDLRYANDNHYGELRQHSLEEITGPKVEFSSLALAHLMEARDADDQFLIDPQEDGITVVAHNRRSTDRIEMPVAHNRRSTDRVEMPVINMAADRTGVFQPA